MADQASHKKSLSVLWKFILITTVALGVLALCLTLVSNGNNVKDTREGTVRIAGVPVHNYHLRRDVRESSVDVPWYTRKLRGHEINDWILQIKGSPTDQELHDVCSSLPGQAKCLFEGHPNQGGMPVVVLRASQSELEACLATFGDVLEHVEPDGELTAADVSSWGLDRIDARSGLDNSYESSLTGEGVHVYVIDTGIRTTHEDFKAADGTSRAVPTLEVLGKGVVECDSSDTSCAADRDSHGTHCAGTIGGRKYGVAKGATLHAVKMLDDNGSGSWSWFIEALEWIAIHGQRPAVISASLGGRGASESIRRAVMKAVQADVTVVVAAGNSKMDACEYSPAFVPEAITVGASDRFDVMASFSNRGPCVDIFAPGVKITSAVSKSDTASAAYSGTSMACPHVAGAAALLLEKDSDLSPAGVTEQLRSRATPYVLSKIGSSDNLLLYVGEGPSISTTTTTTTPWPYPWRVRDGSCTIDGDGCVLSQHFPREYDPVGTCYIDVNVSAARPIIVKHWKVGTLGRDHLMVNGKMYDSKTRGPHGVTPTGAIQWMNYRSAQGWKICMEGGPTTTTTTTTRAVATSTTTIGNTIISTTSRHGIEGLTPEEVAVYNPALGSYWDLQHCGGATDNNNWEWCSEHEFDCQESVAVSKSLCPSGEAVRNFTRTFAEVDGCLFAYYAQYVCKDATSTTKPATTVVTTTTTTTSTVVTTTTTTTSSTTTIRSIEGLTPDEAAVYNPQLSSYWDLGHCGKESDDHNADWCAHSPGKCSQSVGVSKTLCASGEVVLRFTRICQSGWLLLCILRTVRLQGR